MSDPVSFPKLHRWHSNAEAAADALELPDDWTAGRGEPVNGYVTITPEVEAAADTAFVVTSGADGDTLHVSGADAGNFLYPVRPIRKYAERWARGFEPDAKVPGRSEPLVPSGIGWYVLGLANDTPRPALTLHIPINERGISNPITVTDDVVRTTQLTYRRAEAILEGGQTEESQTGLAGLKRVSGLLAAARGEQQPSAPADIVREATGAAEQALATYMQANGIPGLYKASVHPDAVIGKMWSPHPQGFDSRKAHASWAAPLHELASFVNHCNVAAFRNKKAYPYPQSRLETMARQYNRNNLEKNVATLTTELQEQYQGEWYNARFSAVELRGFIERSSVDPLDLAIAMFAASGRMGEIRQTQEAAARYIAASPHLARLVLGTALAHNALVLTEPQPDAAQTLILSDGAHERYEYGKDETFGLVESDVAFIGRAAGIANLKPGMAQSPPTGKTARTRRTAVATTLSAKRAANSGQPAEPHKAAKKILPGKPKPPRAAGARRAEAFTNPRIALAARMMTAGCKAPAFSFDVPGECTATVTDPDGTSYTVTIPGKKDTATKNRVAEALLAKLPSLPLNKRGDMWQGQTAVTEGGTE